jgi:hypothetical protein
MLGICGCCIDRLVIACWKLVIQGGEERKTNVAAYTPYDIIGRFTSE